MPQVTLQALEQHVALAAGRARGNSNLAQSPHRSENGQLEERTVNKLRG